MVTPTATLRYPDSMPSPIRPGSQLSRLEQIADWVEPGARLADIGSDHGRLPHYLLQTGRASFCIATEKNRSRLRKLEKAWPGSRPESLEFRAGDGLAPLRPEDRIDTVVIAGMGAKSLLRILDDSQAPIPARLILQPQTDVASVRRWIWGTGRALLDEAFVSDRGRDYTLLSAADGPAEPDIWIHEGLTREDLFHVGPILVRTRPPGLLPYWIAQRDRIAQFCAADGDSDKPAELERIRRILGSLGRTGPNLEPRSTG